MVIEGSSDYKYVRKRCSLKNLWLNGCLWNQKWFFNGIAWRLLFLRVYRDTKAPCWVHETVRAHREDDNYDLHTCVSRDRQLPKAIMDNAVPSPENPLCSCWRLHSAASQTHRDSFTCLCLVSCIKKSRDGALRISAELIMDSDRNWCIRMLLKHWISLELNMLEQSEMLDSIQNVAKMLDSIQNVAKMLDSNIIRCLGILRTCRIPIEFDMLLKCWILINVLCVRESIEFNRFVAFRIHFWHVRIHNNIHIPFIMLLRCSNIIHHVRTVLKSWIPVNIQKSSVFATWQHVEFYKNPTF